MGYISYFDTEPRLSFMDERPVGPPERPTISVDRASGVVDGARFVVSPNCDGRPAGCAIEVLIIHAISLPPGQFGGADIERLFCNSLDVTRHPFYEGLRDLRVSAHLLIRRDGELVQFVPFTARAWHAGVSRCEGRTRVNDFSIGIELEGADSVPFAEVQYQVLAAVTCGIVQAYPRITPQRIYGHSDIAPGRKTDPGPSFDWSRYRQSLSHI